MFVKQLCGITIIEEMYEDHTIDMVVKELGYVSLRGCYLEARPSAPPTVAFSG